jgi:hypothetical protein
MDRNRRSFCGMGWSGFLTVLLLGGAAAASADLRLTDPASEVYYNYGLVAGAALSVGERGTVTGNVDSNGTLVLGEHSTVTGNASSVGKLTNKGRVTGTVDPHAPVLALPVLASRDDLRRLATRVLAGNQRFTNAVINDILFVDGDVTLLGSLKGTGTVISTHDLHVGEAGEPVTIHFFSEWRVSFIP